MVGKPAARLGDTTAHGNPLGPGTCSPNVWIGRKPAWRGLSPAMVQQLLKTFQEVLERAAEVVASPSEVVRTERLKKMNETVAKMLSIMASADKHACAVIKLLIPDGQGVVINGSSTVLINGLPACRMGDTILETTSVNTIAAGEPTVWIGSGGTAPIDPSVANSISAYQAKQSEAEQKEKEKKS